MTDENRKRLTEHFSWIPQGTFVSLSHTPASFFFTWGFYTRHTVENKMQRFVRALSTKAAKSHTPPIKIYGVHGKYAEATYIAASKVSFIACTVRRTVFMQLVINSYALMGRC